MRGLRAEVEHTVEVVIEVLLGPELFHSTLHHSFDFAPSIQSFIWYQMQAFSHLVFM